MGYKAQRRRCIAQSKSTGKPCRAYAVVGHTVCWKHGGAAPQVQAKAKERQDEIQVSALVQLEQLLPKAIAAMERVLDDEDARPADAIAAANGIIDRFVPKKLHVEEDGGQEEREMDAEIDEIMGDMLRRIRDEDAS